MLRKSLLATLIIGVLIFSAGGLVFATDIFEPQSTNTVTQTVYPTTTATVTTTGPIATTVTTVTPYETLSTSTVSGTSTYTATSTTTLAGSTTTVTSTASTDYYIPFYMYWTLSNNTGFYSQLTPISVTQNGDTLTESAIGGTASMSITQVTTNYNDLGFYYEFQNLNLGWLATAGNSITITSTAGSSYGVNLYLNPQDWTWAPTSSSSIQKWTGLGSDGAYGLGPSGTSPTLTVNSLTSIYAVGAMGSCASGTTNTIAQIVSATGCNVNPSTPFALWIGVGPITSGSVSATITSIVSSPYSP